ncbi:AsmA family protein [Mesorhizobium xinjiangense]|uniref:AsmA family protein n=1 Tax=Mesorhizobium xinjiangense TaxID=2678685 RepID=UPI0012EDA310|nr:AsmA-like C-terminal region-containing protein [Mesorhizobium xinjiangense]
MPSKAARRTIWVLVTAGLVLLALVALVPWVASTQIVRNRIAQEMGTWSGYRVQLGGAPRIDVWPSFRAVLHDVTFIAWSRPDAPPVLYAERIEIDLSAIAALRGDVVYSRVSLVRPVLRVIDGGEGAVPRPAAPGGGRMVRAINAARSAIEANGSESGPEALPTDTFGAIHFTDGRVVTPGAPEDHDILTSVTGRLDWPSLNRSGTLAGTAIWRGENVKLNITAEHPLALLAGGNSQLSAKLESNPVNVSYSGAATFSQAGFLDGQAELSSPSLKRILEWTQTEIAAGTAIGPVSLNGRLIGDMQRLKVENAAISIDGNPGTGVLEFSPGTPVPAISGTLAFETLDLRTFLRAFTTLPGGENGWSGAVDTSFTSELNLDLRLSAANASAGPFALTQVAATVQVKDGLAAFDISDAAAFGGTLQVGLRIDRRDNGNEGEVRLLATDVDMGQFGKAAGFTGPAPQAKGVTSVILKGPVATWDTLFAGANGSISLMLGPGSINGIDLAAFMARAREGGFFPLAEVSDGSLPIQSAELKATVSSGVARLDMARIVSGERTISLGGLIPYVGRGLALSGLIAPQETDDETDGGGEVTGFFVGGSWSAPFISLVLPPNPVE